MKQYEARTKAKELWGALSFAKIIRALGKKHIGKKVNIGKYWIDETYGFGNTWEECFEDAKKRGYIK